MIRIRIPGKARNAVALNKRTAAFLIYGAKKGRTDNLLSNSLGLEINLNATAALRKRGKLFERVAPNNGAALFFHSTKDKRFRRKMGSTFCNDPIQPGIFCFRHRNPELRISLCADVLIASVRPYSPRAPPASEIKDFTPISEEQEATLWQGNISEKRNRMIKAPTAIGS